MTAENSPPVSTATLADWARDARQRTLELVNDLSDEQLIGPRLVVLNPPLWEIGRLGWLQEKEILRRANEPSLLPNADALFDDNVVPHAQRWELALPAREAIMRYLQAVQGAILEWLQRGPPAAELTWMRQAIDWEDLQGEKLLQARQTLGYAAPRLSSVGEPPAAAGSWPGDVEVPGGIFLVNATPLEIGPFRIARSPVTQSEFAGFVERGGYYRPELWSADGWLWRQATDARHPIYWRRASTGVWQRRQFDQWRMLEPHQPAVHVSWYEAEAYCEWVSRRLPTEAEWETAAAAEPAPTGGLADGKRRFPWGDSPPQPDHAHLDGRYLGCIDVACCPAGDSAFGCRQMIGNVWEWTANDFLPSGDQTLDLSVENSGMAKVLRGGSWATRSRLVHNAHRRRASPSRCDLVAGFRTCAR